MIHLLHISKCGGTAIRNSLLPSANSDKHWSRQLGDSRLQIYQHHTSLYDVPINKAVLFIRNPMTRFISGYNCRLRNYNEKMSGKEKKALNIFKNANELAESLSSDTFKVRRTALHACTLHIKHLCWPYRKWLGHPHNFDIMHKKMFFIGLTEYLPHDFACFCDKFNVSVKLTDDSVKANINPTEIQLSEKAKENIRSLYKEDFILYDLCCKERSRRLAI